MSSGRPLAGPPASHARRSRACPCPVGGRPARAAQGTGRPPRQWLWPRRAGRRERVPGGVSSQEADPAARQRRRAPPRAAAAAAPHPAASRLARRPAPGEAACQYVADWPLSLALSSRRDRDRRNAADGGEGGHYAGQGYPRRDDHDRRAGPAGAGTTAGRGDPGADMTAVAVVGLGAMGSRIAARLLAAGREVIVWNRSAGKTEPLTAIGAVAAASPAEAASRVGVLITMVADPAALRSVTEGPGGVAAGAGASLSVVEMSTVGPAAVARLAAVLPPATGLLDAPVLGSRAEAESGSLVTLSAGPAPLVARENHQRPRRGLRP